MDDFTSIEFFVPQSINSLRSDMQFVDYLKAWLEVVKIRVKPTTYNSYVCIVERKLEPYFKILSSLKKYQKTLAVFVEDVMLYEKNTNPTLAFTKIDHNRIPSISFSGLTTLICNNPEPEMNLVEAFIPDTFDDLISYLLNRYIIGYHFYRCANCGRYFAFTTDTKNKSCTRVIESAHYIKDIGRTCRDVGRLRSHVRGLYSNETQVLYQRNYKATFARKSKGQITEEHFAAWSETARLMRDKCINGDISYDELEQWFFNNYLRE